MQRLLVIFLVLSAFAAHADTLGTPPAMTVSPRVLNIALVNRCLRVIGTGADADERKLLDLLTKARAYISAGKTDEALDDADRLVGAEPNSSVALIYRASAEFAMQKWNPAIKDLGDAIAVKQTPKSITALAYYMRAEFRLSDNRASLKDLDQAIAMNPNLAAAYAYRGSLLEMEMKYDKAAADLDKAISLAPEEPYGYVLRGNFRYAHGTEAAAIGDLDRAIALDPRNPLGYWLRGRIYFYKGDRKSADRDFEQADAIFSEIEAQ